MRLTNCMDAHRCRQSSSSVSLRRASGQGPGFSSSVSPTCSTIGADTPGDRARPRKSRSRPSRTATAFLPQTRKSSLGLGDGRAAGAFDDHHLAPAVAQVRDLERVAGPQRLKSVAGQWQHRARRRRTRLRVGGARKPNSSRCHQPAGGIATWLDADEVPDGPCYRPRFVHPGRLDDTTATDGLLCAAQVCGHPAPGRRVVVRAVDPHQVHAGPPAGPRPGIVDRPRRWASSP